ncbi:MAG: hypothetical protein DCC57_14735 [Chloroflexi bacterium]|nr:MAG: hypothetical protein DCC57_14735 [Chloroflexota bacterium]
MIRLSTVSRRDRWIVAGLHGIGLALLALHLFVRTLPPSATPIPEPGDAEAAWWGLWPVIYLATPYVIAGALAVLAAMGWGWARLARPGAPAARSLPYARPAVALLLALAFFAFPIAHTRWGDAYMLAHGIAWPDPALRLTHSWQAPLDVFLHSQVWLALHGSLGWQDATPVYRLLSPLAGLLYLGGVLAISADERFAPGWLSFGLLTSLGLIQLFFGYVENYSFAAAGVLLYLAWGRRVLAGYSPLWQAAALLALTHATHPSTIILAPSLLFLGWRVAQRRLDEAGVHGTRSRGRVVFGVILSIMLPMLLAGGATILLMERGGHGLAALLTTDRPGGGDGRWFVPLWQTTTRWEHYTLLSWPHLRDVINQQLLVAPVVLPALLWLGLCCRNMSGAALVSKLGAGEAGLRRSTLRFYALAAVCYLAFTLVWNPDYGGQRDWDLFSLAALPAALWLLALAPWVATRRALAAGMFPLILLQALHTAAWVYQNTLPWEWP